MKLIYYEFMGLIETITLALQCIFQMIYLLIELLGKCFSFLFKVIGVLPTSFTVSFIALVAIAIIYKLLGREAGN